jgi:hypothetical protein
MDILHGYTAWTYSMGIQHGHGAWAFSMETWALSMETGTYIKHGMEY